MSDSRLHVTSLVPGADERSTRARLVCRVPFVLLTMALDERNVQRFLLKRTATAVRPWQQNRFVVDRSQ